MHLYRPLYILLVGLNLIGPCCASRQWPSGHITPLCVSIYSTPLKWCHVIHCLLIHHSTHIVVYSTAIIYNIYLSPGSSTLHAIYPMNFPQQFCINTYGTKHVILHYRWVMTYNFPFAYIYFKIQYILSLRDIILA